ncbi:hypothetical protein DTL42_20435 [Bremerella cremea]|uniref:Cytochrome c domain-containing protein n=1 Tax=Bremerella cremea TaxID=1031537 RepID=A0A368KLZ7_9BACT|nr:di-heme oxidoredictase family protein [Bremerella cremea]RCS42199.1 hypothetical protein DTL42_20435 [Bremerella cremea]
MAKWTRFFGISLVLSLATWASVQAQFDSGAGRVAEGRELFLHQWEPNDPLSPNGDGLGPLFNGKGCVNCHSLGGVGGSGNLANNAQFLSFLPETGEFTRRTAKKFLGTLHRMHPDFVDTQGRFSLGVLLHRESTNPEFVSKRADVTATLPSTNQSKARILKMLSRRDLPKINALPLNLVIFHEGVQYALAERNPPQLFGVDEIDRKISDSDIDALVEIQKGSTTGVSGRKSGRFGWRGQMKDLDLFIKGACATEIGLQVHEFHQTKDPLQPDYELEGSDLSGEQVNALIQYVRSLPRPEQVLPAEEKGKQRIAEGQISFNAIGCAECHVADVGQVSGVFSDFLLHDMGPLFEDPIPAEPLPEISVGANMDVISGYHGMVRREPAPLLAIDQQHHMEYRTPPLWGVADSAPYMHDGRAQTLRGAIEWHGGEAKTSVRRFALMSEEKQYALIQFLQSLKAPQSAEEAPAGISVTAEASHGVAR